MIRVTRVMYCATIVVYHTVRVIEKMQSTDDK